MNRSPIGRPWRALAAGLMVFVALGISQAGTWGIAHGQTAPGQETPVMPSASTPVSFPPPRPAVPTSTSTFQPTRAPTKTATAYATGTGLITTATPPIAATVGSVGASGVSTTPVRVTGQGTPLPTATPVASTTPVLGVTATQPTAVEDSPPTATLVPMVIGAPLDTATTATTMTPEPILPVTPQPAPATGLSPSLDNTAGPPVVAVIGEVLIALGIIVVIGTIARKVLSR